MASGDLLLVEILAELGVAFEENDVDGRSPSLQLARPVSNGRQWND